MRASGEGRRLRPAPFYALGNIFFVPAFEQKAAPFPPTPPPLGRRKNTEKPGAIIRASLFGSSRLSEWSMTSPHDDLD